MKSGAGLGTGTPLLLRVRRDRPPSQRTAGDERRGGWFEDGCLRGARRQFPDMPLHEVRGRLLHRFVGHAQRRRPFAGRHRQRGAASLQACIARAGARRFARIRSAMGASSISGASSSPSSSSRWGAGVSIYQGIHHVMDPEPIENPNWNLRGTRRLLFCSKASPGWWRCASSASRRGSAGYVEAIRRSKDPTTFTVLLGRQRRADRARDRLRRHLPREYLDRPELDGLASIGIGLLLAGGRHLPRPREQGAPDR